MLPLYSLMVATEPLPAEVERIGPAERETFSDGRHLLIYGQRTADDRFALGGRGALYHFGSAITDAYDRDRQAEELAAVLRQPSRPHRRGDRPPLGWTARRTPRLGRVGDLRPPAGSAPRAATSATACPPRTWRRTPGRPGARPRHRAGPPALGRAPPRTEPLRWIGVNTGRVLAATLDRRETRTPSAVPVARRDCFDRATGGH